MAFTQADIDALETAMKSGQLRVRFADSEVIYRSVAEMSQLLRRMKNDVNGTPPGPRALAADFSGDPTLTDPCWP